MKRMGGEKKNQAVISNVVCNLACRDQVSKIFFMTSFRQTILVNFFRKRAHSDRLCGLVVRVSGYRYRGPGFDRRRYQIF